ncbi:MAG: 2-oxoacid:ferredoxin oxidoreductase subunit beta [Phycisphaerae bacterium]|nr:2-oxoacid:ferredoxin oxidoreductase subunit beta [Phycisphaerae bacterium]NNF44887.1 2-oxoacid:ferredoxin oxidoreductase subunit beta [Phycisphaerales bacterium]
MPDTALPTYKAKDFTTDQEVRWCPGCGDYAILAAVRKTLPKLQTRKEDYVFVSGIGCAARFPYYMNTYGMHSIHGRAPAFATGVKLANPQLDVWLASGDGDLLSIGGNHTMHMMRRNLDINVLLFNNRIYGLTKGQYSPTSEFGKKTKSTPMGSLDYPVNPLQLAIGTGCTFVARSIDVDMKHLEAVMLAAAAHRGTAFIEIYQDCNIFNHQAFFYASQKDTKADATIELEHGKPLIFGADREKGIRFRGTKLEVVTLGNGISESDLVVHDMHDHGLAFLLAQMTHPEFPEIRGILFQDTERKPYDELVHEQLEQAVEAHGHGDLHALLHEGDTWEVTG